MTEIKWIKINVNMTDNRKIKRIRRLPDGNNVVLFWVFLLTKAGESNKQGGLFFLEDMPYTVDDLAEEFDFTHDFVKFALKTLENLNMIELFDEIIYIKNWEKYQSVDGMERVRKLNAERNRKYRERQKQLKLESRDVSVTSRDGTDIDKDIDKEYIYTLFNYWNEQGIIKHRKMNQAMQSHINARLQEYSLDELKQAINNYSTILNSDDYYWTHKWSLQDFMKPNNVTRFVDEAEPFDNFKSNKSTKKKELDISDFNLDD